MNEADNQILLVGGLNIGLLSGKSHIYNADKQKINYNGDLEIPVPDISRFTYKYRENKVYVVG